MLIFNLRIAHARLFSATFQLRINTENHVLLDRSDNRQLICNSNTCIVLKIRALCSITRSSLFCLVFQFLHFHYCTWDLKMHRDKPHNKPIHLQRYWQNCIFTLNLMERKTHRVLSHKQNRSKHKKAFTFLVPRKLASFFFLRIISASSYVYIRKFAAVNLGYCHFMP